VNVLLATEILPQDQGFMILALAFVTLFAAVLLFALARRR